MRVIGAAIVFVAVFLWLFLRNDYYPPATLAIDGIAEGAFTLGVSWDSGDGFNASERVTVGIDDPAIGSEPVVHRFAVRRLPERNVEASGGEVWLLGLSTDTVERVDLRGLHVPGEATLRPEGAIVLDTDGRSVRFDGPFRRITVRLYKHPWSGKAELSLDGVTHVVDLYSVTPGTEILTLEAPRPASTAPRPYRFSRVLQLPQHRTKRLRLSASRPFRLAALTINVPGRSVSLPVAATNGVVTRRVWRLRRADRTALHYILVSVHAAMALLAAAAAHALLGSASRSAVSCRDTVRSVFWANGRWTMWIMFTLSTAWLGTWLLGQWPGMLSPDCLTTWSEVHNLQIVNWSPFVHTLYALALAQIHRSPATIAAFQIVAISAIAAILYHRLLRLGAPRLLVAASFLAFLVAVPNAVFAIVPWRDTPFSYLMLLTTFVLYELRLRRNVTGTAPHLSNGALHGLAMLIAMVSLFRHNGAANLAIVPAILLAAGALARRQLAHVTVAATLIYALVQFGVGFYVHAHQNFDYAKMRISVVLNPIAAVMTARGGYVTQDPAKDAATVERFIAMDEVRQHYNPFSVVSLLYRPGNRWDLAAEDTRRMQELYVRLVLDNLPLYLANQIVTFGSAVGYRGYKYEHLVRTRDTWIWKTPGDDLAGYNTLKSLRFEPWSDRLRAFQDRVLAATYQYTGFWSLSHLVWNAWLPLLFVVVASYAYAWLPATAAAATFLLAHLVLLFLVVLSADFRYVYWLYLYGFFALPMAAAEWRSGRVDQPAPVG